MPIIILIALLIGGGTSAVANSALPGEILYPVKVSVNEQVVGWLSVSNEAKAKWETKIAGRRLEEAEELTAKQGMDADAKAEIEARFKAHADRVAVRIDKLEAKENFEAASDVASNFEVALKAHEKVLNMLVKQGFNGKVRDIALKVEIEAENAEDKRAEVELKFAKGPDTEGAALGKLEAAENKLAETKRFFENKKPLLSAEDITKVEAQLKIANDLIAQGKVKLEAKSYAEAFQLFQRAHRTAQSVKAIIEIKEDLEKDNDDDNEDEDEDENNENRGRKDKDRNDLEIDIDF